MSYRVIAPCVVAKDQDGKNRHRYEGDVIAWLSDEQAEHFVAAGLVEETSVGVGGSDPVADPESVEGAKPSEDAQKPELIDWVRKNLVKDDGTDYTEAELKRLNKDQLWGLINAVPDDPDTGSEE